MNYIEETKLHGILIDNPAFGCKALDIPFVLVIKTSTGTFVAHQRDGRQNTANVSGSIFGENVGIDSIFHIEIGSQNLLAFAVCSFDTDGRATGKSFYTIGDKGKQALYATAFFAYEAEQDRSVHCVSVIEEFGSKPVFTDAVRYGKNSRKLLKTQLRMYLALSDVDSETREKIVSGGGLLPPSNRTDNGGNQDD